MFRPAQPGDLDRLYVIWYEAVKATHHFLSDADFDEIADLVKHQYLPNAAFLVDEDDEGIITAFMGTTDNSIDALFVHPDFHGTGAGSKFVKHMQGVHPTVVLEVNEQNPGALAFYQKHGFEVVKRDPTDDHGRPFPILHMRWQA